MDIPLFAQESLAASPSFLVGEEIIQTRHDRLFSHLVVVVKTQLGIKVIDKISCHKRRVRPGLAIDAAGTDFRSSGLGDDRGANGHAGIHGFCHPDRRHGIAVTAGIGDDFNNDACWICIGLFVVVGNRFRKQRAAGIGMGYRHILHFLGPDPLEIDTAFRGRLTVTGPARFFLFVHQNVGEDHLCARLAEALHQVGVACLIDVLDDAENANFRVDRPQSTVLVNPHLGQIVADKIAANHGRGGFTATRRCGPGKIGFSAARASHAGDKHMLGEFHARIFVHGTVRGKTMIAFFHQQGVACIGAEGRKGGLPAAIHVNARFRHVLGAVGSFRVDIGEKFASPDDFSIKDSVAVAIEQLR